MGICECINGQTHTSKVWAILSSLLGQPKTYNGAARVALLEGISGQELAEHAAQVFFFQTSGPTATTYQKDASSEDSESLNISFSMPELQHALQHANARSTSGDDGVCVAHLRNMPHDYKHSSRRVQRSLGNRNTAFRGKFSEVKPIPKPGKPPHTLSNLNPVSLM
ncbi:hypothetical protein HPB48_021343 [Haemaphysalis longicornis]|uniref:Uncharacterized protein n=1 Tax=Haemaphysalis longicornis TaxID=44386 RepID=A0A9J6GK72_HAELO|nr:hypothetical protein HPB48_021343 [Haemaphysalis longicornis]